MTSLTAWQVLLIVGIALVLMDYFIFPLLLFPFGFGFIAASLVLYLTNSNFWAWITFSLISILGIIYAYKLRQKSKPQKEIKDTPDFQGRVGKVIGREGAFYKVEFSTGLMGETLWLAKPKNDEELKEGQKVEVVELRGNILIVEPIKE
jgi:membrane protein implicated in regulation of membrane protease activity